MLGEYDLAGGAGSAPGARLTSMMAPSIVLAGRSAPARRRQRRLGAAARGDHAGRRQRGRARARGVEEAITAPRVHLDEAHVCTARAAPTRPQLDRLERLGLRASSAGGGGTSTSAASPRSRSPRTARSPRRATLAAAGTESSSASEIDPRGRARDAAGAGRARRGGRLRAGGLADLATAAGARSGTSGATCARSARHPDAAVFVAEMDDGIVGRLSVARDPHPASRHVADLGLMVAAVARRRGVGRALLAGPSTGRAWSGVRKLELHVFPHNEPAIRLYERFGFVREGYRKAHYPPPPRLRRRDPDGLRGSRSVPPGPCSGLTLPLPGRARAPRARASAPATARSSSSASRRSRFGSERSSSSSCFELVAEVDPRGELERERGESAAGSSISLRLGDRDEAAEDLHRPLDLGPSVGLRVVVLDRLDLRRPVRPARRSARATRNRSWPSTSTFIRPSSKVSSTSTHRRARADLAQPARRPRGSARTRCPRRGTRRSAPCSDPRRCGAGPARSATARARAGRGRSRLIAGSLRAPGGGIESARGRFRRPRIADSFFRPVACRSLVPYEPGKPVEEVQRELGLERCVKLASNEGPFGPFPAALEALARCRRGAQPLPGRRRLAAAHARSPSAYGVALRGGRGRRRRGRADRLPLAGDARPGRRDRLRLAVLPELRDRRAQARGASPVQVPLRDAPLRPRGDAGRDRAAHEARLRLPPEQPDRDDEHARRARRLPRPACRSTCSS